eukprot:gi/632980465/ref/XP_007907050.1/ PREDICTED: guanine nucleotide-binding protein-like 3 isoform X1 [Callorhinchus milii]
MKRPKLRKASKRLSCHKRFKIQRKVREHKRKVRKEAKKHGPRKSRRDPGVPNSAPFKEAILREAEQRKQQLEELKLKQKEARQKESAKKRKLEATKKDPVRLEKKRAKKAASQPEKKSPKIEDKNRRKCLCRELNKVIDTSDVLLLVLDARDPLGCRCPEVEQAFLCSEGKKLVFVLNKIDLVPKVNVEKWLQYLMNEFPTVAFKSSTQLPDSTKQEKRLNKHSSHTAISQVRTCTGDETLLKLLTGYCHEAEKSIRVGVVGFPNVGKSSLINSMKKIRACPAGQTRGLTKSMQEVHINKQVKMLDSPSIIASPSNSALALSLREVMDVETLQHSTTLADPILKHCEKQQIMLQYNVSDFRNSLEFLTLLARKRGLLKKGGDPDTAAAARQILSDWTGSKVSYYTCPPVMHQLPAHINSQTVEEARQGFSAEELAKDNKTTLQDVRCPTKASSLVFQSAGLTLGITEENDIEEMDDDDVIEEKTEDEVCGDEDAEQDQTTNTNVEPVKRPGAGDPRKKRLQKPAKSSVTVQSLDLACESHEDDTYDFNTDYVASATISLDSA